MTQQEIQNAAREQVELLESAQESMREAVEYLRSYVKISEDYNTEAYILRHLQVLIDSDHTLMDSSRNIQQVIEEIEEDAEL